jgi:hypothetical protein
MKNYFLVFFFASAINSLFSQDNSFGSWNIINIKGLLSKKWSYFAEAQIRSLKYYQDFHYHEFKGGIIYEINGQFRVSLATGKYDTYKEGGDFVLPKNNDEIRLWPQLLLTQQLGKFIIEQRGRMEMRFSKNGYRNRFRYRVGLNYPFGKNAKGFKPFKCSVSNEVFFTDKEPYFERNRFFLSASYRLSKLFSTQMGYLRQFDYKINDETGRAFFLIGLYFDVDFLRKG